MNQSKKILAALVAVPVSVVVADGVMAAENETVKVETIKLKNELIYGGESVVPTGETINIDLKSAALAKLANFDSEFEYTFTDKNLETAKKDVENLLANLKANLNSIDGSYDFTEIYGMLDNLDVTFTETTTADTASPVKTVAKFNVKYITDKNTAATIGTNLQNTVGVNTPDLNGLKHVHDYVISRTYVNANKHDLKDVVLSDNQKQGMSSHAYAMWTYKVLKAAGFKVKYVQGTQNGQPHSWNLVQLSLDGGAKWYHLNIASDDNSTKNSKDMSYHHFLTGNPINSTDPNYKIDFDYKIEAGNKESVTLEPYNLFANVINPLQIKNLMYYPAKATNGDIQQITFNADGTVSNTKVLDNSTSSVGKMLNYKAADSNYGYLIYVNNKDGNKLYYHNLDTGNPSEQVLINAPIGTIEIKSSNLTYVVLDGTNTPRTVSLSGDINQNFADNVISLIDGLGASPTQAKKQEVLELYKALNDAQKKIVNSKQDTNSEPIYKTKIDELLVQENATENEKVLSVTNQIKAIASSNAWTINDVKAAWEDYIDLTTVQKALVVNAKFLDTAYKHVQAVEELAEDISIFLIDYEPGKLKDNKYYARLDDLYRRYENLYPAVQHAVDPGMLSTLNVYYRAKDTEQVDVTKLLAILNSLNVKNENYLDQVAGMKVLYDQVKAVEHLAILIKNRVTEIENHITKAVELKKIAEDNKGDFEALKDVDGANVTLNDTTLINRANKLQVVFDDGFEASQWKIVGITNPGDQLAIKNAVKNILKRVADQKEALKEHVEKVEDIINKGLDDILEEENLTTKDLATISTSLADIMDQAKEYLDDQTFSSPTSFEEIIVLMDSTTSKRWQEFNRLSTLTNDVAIVRTLMGALSTTTVDTAAVVEARSKYDALSADYKAFVDITKLTTIEKIIANDKAAKEKNDYITKVKAFLEKTPAELADVTNLLADFSKLSEAAQVLVKEDADYKKLEALKIKLEADKLTEDNINKLAKEIEEAINKLTVESTEADFKAVEDKYALLTTDAAKEKVTNYGKIAELKQKIKEKEEAAEKDKQAALDKADADAVIKMIAELTDESTATEIAAVRAAYDVLNENAKKLIVGRTLELLTYYESRIKELSEIAKKEAAVVQDRINRITSSYTEAQIKNIRIAYNALSELAKTYVTNLQTLINAENNVIYQNTVVKQAKLDANAFDVYMNDITRNSTTAQIAQARANYNRLSAEAKRHVTTYEKLVRLETMWKDPEYLDLVFTYYPEYIHEVKPGAIVVQKPTYDPLYIPDDSATNPTTPSPSVATNPVASWSAYETMRFQNGRYTTAISSTQVKNNTDRNMRLKADNIEIVIPTADLKASTATVGVSVNVTNNQLNIQFTEGNNAKYFSDYVEIHVPFSALKGNASQIIERVAATGSAASFKVDGSTFIIRTKTSGTFKATTARTYNDIQPGAQGDAIRELAKRGIQFDTTSRLSQSYKQVTKMDSALMIATALDVSSDAKSKYQDLESDEHTKRVQGLLEAGIMSGATSSRFNPNGTITKQEAAIIIANMYRYLNQDLAKAYSELNSSYRDVAGLTLEARQSIAILELFGVVSGTGSFEPTKQLTRGEFAEIIYKALTAIDYL